ncbi:MAG: transporter substrate-binding domain-containing protein, partial [Hyphomicrobiales bacterium]|nr:transporter substrate-binding domain-containing protein [Hyphomicrobiales bacterium]
MEVSQGSVDSSELPEFSLYEGSGRSSVTYAQQTEQEDVFQIAPQRLQRYVEHRSGIRLLIRLVVIAILIFGWSISAIPAARSEIVLRVGIYQNAPKIYRDEAGQPQGFWPDLVEETSKQKGWTTNYITCEWTACLRMLEEGSIDVMPDVAYSEVRAAKFVFGKDVVFHSWSLIFRQPSVTISGILDLSGLRIAVL